MDALAWEIERLRDEKANLLEALKEMESIWMDMISGREQSIAMDKAVKNAHAAIRAAERKAT